MRPIVYIDMLFLLNFLMNSVTLFVTSNFIKANLSIPRLVVGSVISALYSTLMFFPQTAFLYTAISKIVMFFLTVFVTFPTKAFLSLLKNTAVFFAVNLIFGGMFFALVFFTNFGEALGAAVSNGELYLNISFEALLFSTILSYITVSIILYIKKQTASVQKGIYSITISINGKDVTKKALCDTGCTLSDPISGFPAVIISPKTAKKLLGNSFQENYSAILANKCRILPYTTIDNEGGMLFGFVPDELFVDNKKISCSVVAVAKTDFNQEGQISAIFNPKILEKLNERKAVEVNECIEKANPEPSCVAERKTPYSLYRRNRYTSSASVSRTGRRND